MDDEPCVCQIIATVLKRAGYEAVTAPGPQQALDIVSGGCPFDLVVSDVVMPDMCGPELARQIRRICPSSAIMLMSGCVPVGRLPSGVPFLGKPFSASDLLGAVDRVLRESSGSL